VVPALQSITAYSTSSTTHHMLAQLSMGIVTITVLAGTQILT
jgi:hypothetical protein